MKSTNYYNKKCKGCGAFFSDDEKSLGYVKNLTEDTNYCVRCFQFLNYGKLNSIENNESQIDSILKTLKIDEDLIVMVIDLFDIKNSIVEQFKDYPNLLVVVNKLSCLPQKFNVQATKNNLIRLLDDLGVNTENVVLYDAVFKKNISTIMKYVLRAHNNREKIYFIGKTNVGKSSLINALKKFNKTDSKIVSSPYPNTTLGLIKTNIDRITIIDTPGFFNDNNFMNLLSNEDLKKLNSSNKFVTKIFSLKDDQQCFFVESFFDFSLIRASENAHVTFYIHENFKIHRTNIKNYQKIKDNEKQLFKFHIKNDNHKTVHESISLIGDKKYNLFVPGICLISFKNIKEISFNQKENLSIFLTENAII